MNIELSPQQKKIFVFLISGFVVAFGLIAVFVLGPQIGKKHEPGPSEQGNTQPRTQEEIDAKLKELAAPANTPVPTQEEIDRKLEELAAPPETPVPTQEEIDARLRELAAPPPSQ